MPKYEYKCSNCDLVQEKTHKASESPIYPCLQCMSADQAYFMKKCVTKVSGIHFKGTGFYETDYKGK